jgi:hypothetical protein
MGLGGQRHAPAALPPVETRYPVYRMLCSPPGPVWADAENLALTEIRSSGRPVRSESLYRLSYTGPHPTCKPANMSTTLSPVSHNDVSMCTEV